MKYDCNKTLDCIHEFNRLCHDLHASGCESDCPFFEMDYCGFDLLDENKIALLQKWSDDHPEKPKLTKREYEFLKTFLVSMEKAVVRGKLKKDLYIHDTKYDTHYTIDPTMFSFIQEEEQMTFNELLKLEVEE